MNEHLVLFQSDRHVDISVHSVSRIHFILNHSVIYGHFMLLGEPFYPPQHQHVFFMFFFQDIVDTHPGLTFLKDAPEFHSRYITTVSVKLKD